MSDRSHIEWTDATWPIVQGCDPVSPGCANCYAIEELWRMVHHPNGKISAPLKGLTEKHVNRAGEEILRFSGKVALREDRLDWPLHWKKPRKIFVSSHGDLFHKDVPDEFIDRVFARMALCPQHTFQVLTKRSERMSAYLNAGRLPMGEPRRFISIEDGERARRHDPYFKLPQQIWPLPNVWLGVSCEDQKCADERIWHLLATSAAVRFISAEPLLGPINLTRLLGPHVERGAIDALSGHTWKATDKVHAPPSGNCSKLDLVIAGGESGKGARITPPGAFEHLRDQCRAAGTAFFFKQWGEHRCFKSRTCDDALTYVIKRVGKKRAGRSLDGVFHNDLPQVSA